MKTFTQTFTRSTNFATQTKSEACFGRSVFFQGGSSTHTGGFLFAAIMLPQGVVLKREVTTK